MIFKNEGWLNFGLIFLTKFCLEMMAAISFFLKGEKANARAIWKGYKEFLIHRNISEDQIVKVNKEKSVPGKGPVRFLILSTGILKKKTFQSL
ncbi:hypothetical protein V8V91_08805 [Algoriphagus halophilus]|uniref:hypothetical protein n=1 Tax=Algoriphagus halophilus TaxID=226505 RepID=UPI00358F68C6